MNSEQKAQSLLNLIKSFSASGSDLNEKSNVKQSGSLKFTNYPTELIQELR